jgi:hypothetical protein
VFPAYANHLVDALFAYAALWNAKPELLLLMDDRFPHTLDDLSRVVAAYPQQPLTFGVKPDEGHAQPLSFVSVVHAWCYFSKCAELRSRSDWSDDDKCEQQALLNDLHLHPQVTMEQIPVDVTTQSLFATPCLPYQHSELDYYPFNTWVDRNRRRLPPTLWRLRQAKYHASPLLRYVFFQMPWTAVHWLTADDFRGADLDEFRGWYMCQEWLNHYAHFPAWVCTEDPGSALTRDMIYGLLRPDVPLLDGALVAHLVHLFADAFQTSAEPRQIQWVSRATDVLPIVRDASASALAVWCGDHALLCDAPTHVWVMHSTPGALSPEWPSFEQRLGGQTLLQVDTLADRFPTCAGSDQKALRALLGLLQWVAHCVDWQMPCDDDLAAVRQQLVQDVLNQRVSYSYWKTHFALP